MGGEEDTRWGSVSAAATGATGGGCDRSDGGLPGSGNHGGGGVSSENGEEDAAGGVEEASRCCFGGIRVALLG
ncbi:hypothetical protein GUJ93_ZPchr0005g15507 [Zizania palustris]|uniref:Uncharacterized protein n=1 Tax=Zizania palustris TaxID=103762 RepID=A0A8J5SKQ3_ZIZPA|nr:hypothetical protein GUJ93_ZPchr0005g15507 [Zizania palustris]